MRKIFIQLTLFIISSWTLSAQNLSFTAGDATGGCGSGPIEVNITTNDFTDITSVGFSIRWDPAVLEFVSIQNKFRDDDNDIRFRDSDFNIRTEVTDLGSLGFNWFTSSNTSIADGTVIFTVVFNPAGGGTTGTVAFTDGPPTDISASSNNGSNSFIPTFTNGTVTINSAGSDNTDPIITNCPSNITVTAAQNETTANVSWTVPTASDDCALDDLVTTHEPNTDFPIGLTKVTYTATDAADNTATCTFDVTVEENPNMTGSGTGEVEFIAASPTVPCGVDVITVDISTRNFVDLTSVSYSVEWDETVLNFNRIIIPDVDPLDLDESGNFNTMSDVTDSGAIGFNWFSGTNTTLGENDVLFAIEFIPTGNGNTSSITFTDGPPTSINITKNSGMESVDNPVLTAGTVTIDTSNDSQNPTISNCPNDITATVAPGTTSTTIDWVAPNASDNCNLFSFSGTHAPGDDFVVGETTVTYTATDAANNTSICEFTVTIEEEETEDLLIRASNEQQNCPDSTVTVDITAENFTNITSLSFSVEWDETVLTFAQITNLNEVDLGMEEDDFNTNAEFVNNGSLGFSWFNFTNRSIDPNAILFSIVYTRGNGTGSTSTISFTDGPPTTIGATANNGNDQVTPLFAAGNVNFATTDDTPPTIFSCPSSLIISTDADDCTVSHSWTIPTATDECGMATVTGTHQPGFSFPIGSTTVTYTATDQSDNTSTCAFVVTVRDDQLPTISCPTEVNETITGSTTSIVINDIAPSGISDNCAVSSVSYTLAGATNMTGDNDASGNTFNLGTTQVTYVVTDENGNENSCSFDVNVTDDTPDITCPASVSESADFGLCSTQVDDINVVINSPAIENIQSINWTLTGATEETGEGDASGTSFNVGITNVTYTVTTNGGSTATCSFSVTILDNERPTIICPTEVNETVTGTATSVVVNNIALASIAENCTVDSILYRLEGATNMTGEGDASGTSFNIGTTEVTYTVIDESGNRASCSFDINVIDDMPDITCPASVSESADFGLCSAQVDDINVVINSPAIENIQSINWTLTGATEETGDGDVSGTRFNAGITEVTYTVTTNGGSTATCSFSVTVLDNERPTISCPDNVEISTSEGENSVVVNNIAPSNTADNCSIQSITYTLAGATTMTGENDASGTSFNIGVTTVTYTITDSNDNNRTCSFEVNVAGDTPMITCPDNRTVTVNNGACDAVVNNIDVNIISPTTGTTQSWVFTGATERTGTENASGQQFNIGTTTVTYTVANSEGKTATCSFFVSVEDDVDPVFSEPCPANMIVNTDNNRCSAVVNFTLPTADDNCFVEVTSNPAPGDVFPIGTTEVIVTARDSDNNTTTCTFTVTVNDTQVPVISCPVDVNIDATEATQVDDIDPTVDDNCGDATVTYSLTGAMTGSGDDSASGLIFEPGVTTVTYIATDDNNNTASCSFEVTIEEAMMDTPIEITCPNDVVASTDEGSCNAVVDDIGPTFNEGSILDELTYTLEGATTGSGSNAVSGTSFNVGTTTVTYIATDTGGRKDTCSFTILINDTESPVYTCIADTTIAATTDCNATFDWSNLVILSDNCELDSLTQVNSHTSGDTFSLGTTTVTLSATDKAGNTTTCSFDVIVEDRTAPTASSCPPNITQSHELGTCGAVVSWNIPTYSDNCTNADDIAITASHMPGTTFPVGITTVIYTATDVAGNIDTCQFDINVTDTEAPQFTGCPVDTTISADLAGCEATYNWVAPIATDNCQVLGVQSSHNSGHTFSLGETQVIYSAVDPSGNTMVCMFIVTVVDDTAPVLACPQDVRVRVDGTLLSDPDGILTDIESDNCNTLALSFTEPATAEDECSGTIIVSRSDSNGLNSGDNFSVGTTTFEYTAIDAEGNRATCSFDIIVEGFAPLQIATNDDNPCAGEDLKFIAEEIEGGIYQWVLPDDSVVNDAVLDLDAVTVEQSGIYTINVVDPNGCQYRGSLDLIVSAQPELIIGTGSDMLCTQENATLELMVSEVSGADTVSYIWEGPSNFTSTVQNPTIENATVDNSGTYTVTATTGAGCTTTASIDVTVADRPQSVSLITSTTGEGACVGEPMRLVGTNFNSNAVTYHWIGEGEGNGLIEVDSFINLVTPTAAGIYTYSYYATIGSCTSDTASVSVSVEGLPEISLALDGEMTCADGTSDITIQTTSTGAIVEEWVWEGPDFISTDQNPIITNVTAANSGTYTVTAKTNNGCSITESIEVVVTSQPDAAEITTSVEANCLGTSFTLSVPEYMGNSVSYNWTATADAGLPADFNSNIITVQPSAAGDFTYNLNVIVDGCVSQPSSIDVTTQAEPNLDLAGIPAELNCVDGTTNLVLTDNAGEATTYIWTTPNEVELTGNNATINNITAANSGIYTVEARTSAGCSTTQSFTINITDAIAIPVIGTDNILPCENDDIRLSVTNPIEGATYLWSGPSFSSIEASPIINNVNDLRVGEYTVVVSKNGCTSPTSAAFTLQVLDTPDLEDDAFEALVETPVTVDVLANDLLIPDAKFEIGVISSTFNGKLENNQDGTFTYSPATGTRGFDQFIYEVCYTDCQDNCEIATVSIETKFAPDECVAFNIISPNGDGQNDNFVISCVDNNNFPSNSLVIVNQWGDEIYRAAPYNNDWSGTYNEGPLPDGTYYYIFIPAPQMDAQTGFITIQR